MEWKTSDIVLASYLRMNGFEVVRISKVGNKGFFIFNDVSEEMVAHYDCGRAKVEPLAFNNTIKALAAAVKRL